MPEIEKFVYDWWIKHEMGDDWAMMDVERCVRSAITKEQARIKKIHQEHRGMDWGVNEERFWKEVEGE